MRDEDDNDDSDDKNTRALRSTNMDTVHMDRSLVPAHDTTAANGRNKDTNNMARQDGYG